jgi:hypothetical protein
MMFNAKDKVRVSYINNNGEQVEKELRAESSSYGNPYLLIHDYIGNRYYGRVERDNIPDGLSVELIEKYHPLATFGGASAQIRELVSDRDSNILFLRLAGQEDQVRSITAVIMQGRMKLGDNYLRFSEHYVKVYPEGMRRIIKPIGDGMVDCVLYHRTLLPAVGMEALLHSNGDCFESFKKFLQLLPIPRLYRLENGDALERKILQKLTDHEIVTKASTLVGKVAISVINTEKLNADDYKILRDAIVDVLKDVGYSQAVTPKYDYMIGCPKLYAQDNAKFKKVHAKFFSPSMTWYITEYDVEEGRCFGYVKNEADEQSSEWGYFMLDELAEFKNNYPYHYVERDLHFGDDVYIDSNGKTYKGMPANNESDKEKDVA